MGTGPAGSVFGENSFYRQPGVQDWVGGRQMTKRGVSIQGKFVLSRNPEYKTRGGHHVAKRSSDPRVAYPEVKVQVRDLVRVVGIVAPFCSHGAQFQG